MNLNSEHITLLTKGLIKHSIIPELHNFFSYPSFENFHKACETVPDSDLILKTWLDEPYSEIDRQIYKIYKDIESSIIEHLEEMF